MKRYLTAIILSLACFVYSFSQGRGPEIGVFPPQMHQQICQESTFTRFLEIFNTGDSTLDFNAVLSPDTNWVSVSPIAGKILPGDTTTLEFDFNSSGLPLHNYYANFTINSSDRNHPDTVVLTMLHVQVLNILLQPDSDSICRGCTTKLNLMVYNCSEAYSFDWISDPQGFSSTEKSPVVSPLVNTTYTVTVTDGNYSAQKSVLIKVYGEPGLPENQYFSGISVFPNPVKDKLVLKFESDISLKTVVEIQDPSGRLVKSLKAEVNKGRNEITIDVKGIDPGVYLVSMKSGEKSDPAVLVSAKIIVY